VRTSPPNMEMLQTFHPKVDDLLATLAAPNKKISQNWLPVSRKF
jgi:hypothetical protein